MKKKVPETVNTHYMFCFIGMTNRNFAAKRIKNMTNNVHLIVWPLDRKTPITRQTNFSGKELKLVVIECELSKDVFFVFPIDVLK